jgi:hypothetical protein
MHSRRTCALLCFIVLACWHPDAAAQARHDHAGGMPTLPTVKPCPAGALSCAVSATPFFTRDGTLYLAWSAGGRVVVAQSTDKGAHFTSPVFVNPGEEVVDAGPDPRL